MSTATLTTLIVTIMLAFVGYLATYRANLLLQRRKDRLERVNQQLQNLYGPLFAMLHSGDVAWHMFLEVHGRGSRYFWDPSKPPTVEEAAAWRLWMSTVFMPNNERMAEAVITHAHLLREDHLPVCLIKLCAHVSGYAPVLARWESGEFDPLSARDHVSVIGFPREELEDYVGSSFAELKREQAALLRTVERRADTPPASSTAEAGARSGGLEGVRAG